MGAQGFAGLRVQTLALQGTGQRSYGVSNYNLEHTQPLRQVDNALVQGPLEGRPSLVRTLAPDRKSSLHRTDGDALGTDRSARSRVRTLKARPLPSLGSCSAQASRSR